MAAFNRSSICRYPSSGAKCVAKLCWSKESYWILNSIVYNAKRPVWPIGLELVSHRQEGEPIGQMTATWLARLPLVREEVGLIPTDYH